MIKVRDIFNLPSTPVNIKEDFFTLKGNWVPEIDHLVPDYDQEIAADIDEDGRMAIKTVIIENIDYERYAMMCTVWFDNRPVLIVQEAGRSGRDYFNRWVVDLSTYSEMLVYLTKKFTTTPEAGIQDYLELDADVYPETFFNFYGRSYAKNFGIEVEPIADSLQGVVLLPNRRGLLNALPDYFYLLFIESCQPDAPEYIRRNSVVLKKVRLVPHEEIAEQNPRMISNMESSPDKRLFLYEEATAPKGAIVHPV